MDNALNLLHEQKTGLYKLSRKTFGELIAHFIIGGYEACFKGNTHGSGKVIDSADIKK